ncbi:MAG: hypothetical protein OEO23_10400 [Gemmatimonadota bacterium]|nr:hypothetical protein [Gemmatimonadota bacterium]
MDLFTRQECSRAAGVGPARRAVLSPTPWAWTALWALIAVSSGLVPAQAAGQSRILRPEPGPGDLLRVNVLTPGYGVREVVGELVEWTPDGLQMAGRAPYAWGSVQDLWVSAGQTDALKEGVLIGLALGAMVGTTLGLASRSSTCGDTNRCPITVGLVYGLPIVSLGTLLGGITKKERWVPVVVGPSGR